MNRERWYLCSLLLVCGSVTPLLADDSSSTATAAGQASFSRVCAACHGATGEGGKAPPIVPLVYPQDQVTVIVRSGQGEMPPIARAALSDDELAAIVAYLAQIK